MGSARFRTRRRQLGAIMLAACAIAPVFNVLTSEASAREAWQGAVDGMVISLLVCGSRLFVCDCRLRCVCQRSALWTELAVSSVICLPLFVVGRATGKMLTPLDPPRFVTSFSEPHLRYATPFFAVFAVVITFVLQMNRLVGANVLGYFMAGACHPPPPRGGHFPFLPLPRPPPLPRGPGGARHPQAPPRLA